MKKSNMTEENTNIDLEEDSDETAEAETEDATAATETDATTEDTETEATTTTETCEGSEDTIEASSASSDPLKNREEVLATHLTPQDILHLEGRHIKAEDFEWGKSPIPNLSDIIIQDLDKIEDCKLDKFLQNTTKKQKKRFLETLSLDLPLKITLPLLEDGIYWKRMCLKSWPACDIWRYADNWKSMFVNRTIRELVENFNPDEGDVSQLCDNLKSFANYVTSLQIRKIIKSLEKEVCIDLDSESFDDELDAIIASPKMRIYLDFEKVFGCLEELEELTILLSPKFIDSEDFHFNNADFNCLFRGLRKLKELQMIRFSNGNLTNEQFVEIIKDFLNHQYLTELNFSYNFIDDNVCDYIGKLLISECPLQSLVLKYNKITDEGVKSIAAALSHNSSLKKLDLSLNMIGNEGGCFLAKVLLSNRSITDLDVSKNKLTSEAGAAFASLVKQSDSLRSLKIQENCLGKAVGKMFTDSFTTNCQILELDVHFCGFTNEDEGIIHQSVLKNRSAAACARYKRANKDMTVSECLF